MNCSLVKTTSNDVVLHGLLYEAPKADTILIHIHGTAGNFYENDFIHEEANAVVKNGISFLSTNNRGNGVQQENPKVGSAVEFFEDCVFDIDDWIDFARNKGYQKIILQGHSLGSEKVVYYMNEGNFRKQIIGVILLGFSDSYGNQLKYTKTEKRWEELLQEANKLTDEHKGCQFITSDWLCEAGEVSKSGRSYINFFSKSSELSKTQPFRNSELSMLRSISVPILGVIGDQKEYTIIPTEEAVKLVEAENPLANCIQLKDCSHCFHGKETELCTHIEKFINFLK